MPRARSRSPPARRARRPSALAGCATGTDGPRAPRRRATRPPARARSSTSSSRWASGATSSGRLGGACATVTTMLSSAARRPARLRARHRGPRRLLRTPTSSCSTAPATTTGPQRRRRRPSTPAAGRVSAADVAGVAAPGRRPAPLVLPRRRRSGWRRRSPARADRALRRAPPATSPSRPPRGPRPCSPTTPRSTALRPLAAGHTYAATETVFDRMAAALGLTDAHPAGLPPRVEQRQRPRARRPDRVRAGADRRQRSTCWSTTRRPRAPCPSSCARAAEAGRRAGRRRSRNRRRTGGRFLRRVADRPAHGARRRARADPVTRPTSGHPPSCSTTSASSAGRPDGLVATGTFTRPRRAPSSA